MKPMFDKFLKWYWKYLKLNFQLFINAMVTWLVLYAIASGIAEVLY